MGSMSARPIRPFSAGHDHGPLLAVFIEQGQRREERTGDVLVQDFFALGTQFGCKVDQVGFRNPLTFEGGRFGGVGLRRAACSLGTGEGATERSSIGQTGWPVTRSNTYVKPCLLTWATALIGFPSTVISTRLGAQGKS